MLRVTVGLILMLIPAMAFQNVGISDGGPSKRIVKMTRPAYPAEAKAAGIEGLVRLDLVIGRDGNVKQVKTASGRPELLAAAAEAVKQWVYEPVIQDGEAVEVIQTVDVNFTLQNGPAPVQAGKAPLSIGGSIQEAKLLNKVRPVYPIEAKEAGLEGAVKMVVVIREDGTLGEISKVSGPLPLIQPSVDAVRQWVWKPTTMDGAPVSVTTEILINYTLRK